MTGLTSGHIISFAFYSPTSQLSKLAGVIVLKIKFQMNDILNAIPFVNLRHMPSHGYVMGIPRRGRQLA
jgi:hypothetical protein